ncbi:MULTISPECIES: hypothetical protein [Nocardiopsis]|uniref:Uncharacterized protein n=1 Tax=Nocardiopsis sinuspersici TaxID=501010 RepID=A0A1V3BWF0_9ACTN|nr:MULTISPECIES: hypothetical protein [Nocardiopsis]OOC52440.1 hypothetical protein NOSIN_00145 [Nocardiopsis sinuspersici]
MSVFGTNRELTDDQLDAALAAADAELLDHVSATTTPTNVLLAIMSQEEVVPTHEQVPADRVLRGDIAVEAIMQRHRARLLTAAIQAVGSLDALIDSDRATFLARTLDKTKWLGSDHERSLHFACYLTRDSTENFEGASTLIRQLTGVLAFDPPIAALCSEFSSHLSEAAAHSRDLSFALFDLGCNSPRAGGSKRARGHARALANALSGAVDLRRVLGKALDVARGLALARSKDAAILDVSGADLSHLALEHEDLANLAGVVWTRETCWPHDIAVRLRALSREIQPGVYQVRGGDERDRLGLGIFC